MKSKDFRRLAIENLANRWGKAAILTFIYFLIYGAIEAAIYYISKMNESLTFFALIGIILIFPILNYGFIKELILFRRKEEIAVVDFLKLGFQDFKKVYGVILSLIPKYIGPIILIAITIFLEFVVASIFIFMAMFGAFSEVLQTLMLGGAILMGIIVSIWLIYINYKYHFVFYELVYNPDISSKEIVQTTGKYMKGNCWNLFKLVFTFLGWGILASTLLVGIPFFWLIPYITVAEIFFYEKVSGRLEERNDINQLDVGPIQYGNSEPEENKDFE